MSEPEKDINQIKEERLEKIIEQKVEEKTQKLEKQNQQLKKEIQALKSDSNKSSRTNTKASQGISRRQFLKKAGLGTAGLAALGLTPASALNISTDVLSVSTGSENGDLTEYLSVGQGGPVNISNTNLSLDIDQSIEDSSGTKRFSLEDYRTGIRDEEGNIGISVKSDRDIRLYARDNQPVRIEDLDGGFAGFQYKPSSSSPGTLELTNAEMKYPRSDNTTHGIWKFESESSGRGPERIVQKTEGVSTSQVEIINDHFRGSWFVVNGADGDGTRFVDFIIKAREIGKVVDSVERNSPADRNYNFEPSTTELAMSNGTYNISVVGFRMRPSF